jgi:hypothetical protein
LLGEATPAITNNTTTTPTITWMRLDQVRGSMIGRSFPCSPIRGPAHPPSRRSDSCRGDLLADFCFGDVPITRDRTCEREDSGRATVASRPLCIRKGLTLPASAWALQSASCGSSPEARSAAGDAAVCRPKRMPQLRSGSRLFGAVISVPGDRRSKRLSPLHPVVPDRPWRRRHEEIGARDSGQIAR